nr:MAG TPA: 33 kDa chaperonin [Caudoviricetes sp.]
MYKCNLYNNINKIKDRKNKQLNIFCVFCGSNYVIYCYICNAV